MDKTFDELFNEFFDENKKNNEKDQDENFKYFLKIIKKFSEMDPNDIDNIERMFNLENMSVSIKVMSVDEFLESNLKPSKTLEEQLEEAIQVEDYERAAEIRDMIKASKIEEKPKKSKKRLKEG